MTHQSGIDILSQTDCADTIVNDGIGVLMWLSHRKLDHSSSLCRRQRRPRSLAIKDLADFHDQIARICSGANVDDGQPEVDIRDAVRYETCEQ